MIYKAASELTKDEKEYLDTIAINHVIAQADGFQLGYAQAISDFIDNIVDYWNGSDDKPDISTLNVLVDLGVELGRRKGIAERNTEKASDKGYTNYYSWELKDSDSPWGVHVPIYTKEDNKDDSVEL